MKTLEDITLNFKKLQVTFVSDGIKRTLQGGTSRGIAAGGQQGHLQDIQGTKARIFNSVM